MKNEKHPKSHPGARQAAHNGVDSVMDSAERLKERSNDAVEYLKGKATMAKENVDGYIRKNPEKSVLMAVGVGAIAGAALAASAMRKRK